MLLFFVLNLPPCFSLEHAIASDYKANLSTIQYLKMSEESIRIVTFTEKRSDWRQWSRKFLAVAEKREYRLILESDPEKFALKTEEQKKLNSQAYNDLLLAMTDDVSFGLVDEATSTTYCEGDARMAWGKLMQRF